MVLFLLAWLMAQFETARLKRGMQEQVQAKNAELGRQLSQLAVVPRLLVNHPDIVSALIEQNTHSIMQANSALSLAQHDSDSSVVFAMDIDGTTVASSNYQELVSFVGVNYGFRPYFKGALTGNESTFFAVGATTGIPGYFVANPVVHNNKIVGVVVAKFELDGLLDSWKQPPFNWLTFDEFGVVILATDRRFLYVAPHNLGATALMSIASDRRYEILEDSSYHAKNQSLLDFRLGENRQQFLAQKRELSFENWTLSLVLNHSQIWLRAMLYMLGLSLLGIIVALGYRNVRAQKRLIAAEHKHAMNLEKQVLERTNELRSAQQALISQSNFAMLGRMSGAINHEINQPLASLRLNLASLRSLFDEPDKNMDQLKQIVIDSDRTTKRIGRVITTLRSLSGQHNAVHTQLDVANFVSEVVQTVTRERPALSESMSVDIATALPPIQGNEVLLQQAILNLLYNAFDSVLQAENPSVRFKIDANSTHVLFVVRDNGSGVPEKLRENLFRPFVTNKNQTTGLGLGLTLAELISNEHNGSVSYVPNEGKGSVFTLAVPQLKDESHGIQQT